MKHVLSALFHTKELNPVSQLKQEYLYIKD